MENAIQISKRMDENNDSNKRTNPSCFTKEWWILQFKDNNDKKISGIIIKI